MSPWLVRFIVATRVASVVADGGQGGAVAASFVVAKPSIRAGSGQVISCGLFSEACPGGCYRARSEECMEVGLGHFSPNNDDERYKCLPGFFSNLTNAEACLECASGSMSSEFASEKCISCPIGSFQAFAGKWWCVPCNQTTAEFRKWYCDPPQGAVDERDSVQQSSTAIPSAAPHSTFGRPTRAGQAPTDGTESTNQSDTDVETFMYALIPALGITILLLCACCRGQKHGQDDSTCDCNSQSDGDSQPNDNDFELLHHQDGQSVSCACESSTETSTHDVDDEETGSAQVDNGKNEEEIELAGSGEADGDVSSDSDSWHSAKE